MASYIQKGGGNAATRSAAGNAKPTRSGLAPVGARSRVRRLSHALDARYRFSAELVTAMISISAYRDLQRFFQSEKLMAASELLVSLLFSGLAVARPLQLENMTILAPQETSDHGDPRILCTPTRTTDVASFFLGNYVAHAATVKALP